MVAVVVCNVHVYSVYSVIKNLHGHRPIQSSGRPKHVLLPS